MTKTGTAMRKLLFTLLLTCLFGMARGQTAIYWFDAANGPVTSVPLSGGVLNVDASSLDDGLHALHVQYLPGDGSVSPAVTRYFMRVSVTSGVAGDEAMYWFDGESGTARKAAIADGLFELDASELADGLHALHLQYVLPDGTCSPAVVRYFLRVSDAEEIDGVTLLCTIDGELYSHETLALTNGLASWNADLSGVSEGLHSITLQAVTQSGELTTSYNSFFLRVVEPTPETLRCSYMIDDDTTLKDMGVISQDGTVHFDFDVSELTDGLHSITYILYSDKGGTRMTKRYFMKIPVGGNKLTKYQFLVNDNVDRVRTTELSEHQNPLSVTDLLTVESCPLRSELFHFEITDGTPMMYAMNTLKGWFYDRTGHIGTLEEDYVDYSVSAPVTVSGQLTAGQRETTAWPEANAVKWYTLEALRGDSLRLKLSCAATIQLFAPSGTEVYKADGAKAVKWGGLHVAENGTYYVALHDVTATKGSDISIDYQRFDRYAVLGQDVKAVGNGGPSTITFQGNGFDELGSVDLILGSTTISSVSISSNDKATAAVKFNFSGAELGTYKAVFHYSDGNLEKASCLTVEAAKPVSYKATASYASKFLLSKGNNYNFKLKNQGNMSAYDVPMTVTVYSPSAASLNEVSGKGFALGSYKEDANSGDIEGYPYKRTYELSRTLPPSGSAALTVHVKTTETVHVYLSAEGTRAGGPSTPVASLDPNDIYGYQDENGDKTIRDGLTQVYYTIEFENDPAFATAPAHDIYVTDVLDPTLFDLSTFAPTRVKVGAKEVELDDSKSGSVTFSMMPEIYAVAQLDWSLDETTGTVTWHISSLDPMTVEPTEDLNSGVLPVNVDGNGMGELSFDIQLKPNLADGTVIPNKATIVFDENSPIETPTWENVIFAGEGQEFVLGDVNGNNTIDIGDAVSIVNYLVGKESSTFVEKAADTNKNGQIDIGDAVTIVNYLVGKTTGFARNRSSVWNEIVPE